MSLYGCETWKVTKDISHRLTRMQEDNRQGSLRSQEMARQTRTGEFFRYLLQSGCVYQDTKDRNRERAVGTCDWFTEHDLFQEWSAPTDCPESKLYL